jgi:hypothetical protein
MPKKPVRSSLHYATKNFSAVPAASNAAQAQPIFAQPQPTPDPTSFKDPVTDKKFQEEVSRNRPGRSGATTARRCS